MFPLNISKLKHEFLRLVSAQYATGKELRNDSRKNEETEPKQKHFPAMDVTGDDSIVQCSKEQYSLGTWNVKSMNQGKLEVVKQEMARVNINILEIIELKRTGMGDFNSDDHYLHAPCSKPNIGLVLKFQIHALYLAELKFLLSFG